MRPWRRRDQSAKPRVGRRRNRPVSLRAGKQHPGAGRPPAGRNRPVSLRASERLRVRRQHPGTRRPPAGRNRPVSLRAGRPLRASGAQRRPDAPHRSAPRLCDRPPFQPRRRSRHPGLSPSRRRRSSPHPPRRPTVRRRRGARRRATVPTTSTGPRRNSSRSIASRSEPGRRPTTAAGRLTPPRPGLY